MDGHLLYFELIWTFPNVVTGSGGELKVIKQDKWNFMSQDLSKRVQTQLYMNPIIFETTKPDVNQVRNPH